MKHTNENENGSIKCRICGNRFGNKYDFMNHRKKEHLFSVAFCTNNMNGNCPFSADMCWWKHNENINQNIECYLCGKTFDCKSTLMLHRKREHLTTIRTCKLFEELKCRFDEKECWFKHEGAKKESNKSSFQEAPKKKEPPIVNQ